MAREKNAKNNKGKALRGRHGYAWSPEFGWQVLRRTPGYIAAVDTFLAEAKAAGDSASVAVFTEIMGFRRPLAVGRRKGSKSQRIDLTVYDRILIAKAQTNFDLLLMHAADRSNKDANAIPKTKHFLKFYKKYGDIIAFPLHYEQSRPSPRTLAALWNLFPIVSVKPVGTDLTSRTISLEVRLNVNFSDAAILQEAEKVIKYALNNERKELSPQRFLMGAKRWDHFTQQIQAYDLSVTEGLGYQKIGDEIIGDSEQNRATRKKWAENSINLIKKQLIPFFDR